MIFLVKIIFNFKQVRSCSSVEISESGGGYDRMKIHLKYF